MIEVVLPNAQQVLLQCGRIIGLTVLPELQPRPRLADHLTDQGAAAELGIAGEGNLPDLRQHYGGGGLDRPLSEEGAGHAHWEYQTHPHQSE
jgi:hypothetical protein